MNLGAATQNCYPNQFLWHLVTNSRVLSKGFPTATQPFSMFFTHFETKIPQKSRFWGNKLSERNRDLKFEYFSVIQDRARIFGTSCHSIVLHNTKWSSARCLRQDSARKVVLGPKMHLFCHKCYPNASSEAHQRSASTRSYTFLYSKLLPWAATQPLSRLNL